MAKFKSLFNLTDESMRYNCKSFKGIGKLGHFGSVMERKTGHLLNDLKIYLSGFSRSLIHIPASFIVIVLDNDKRNPEQFIKELEASCSDIEVDHVFCIAIKEMEAWLLGDQEAILSAYPNAKMAIIKKYRQDGIEDTWQILAEMVYPKGLKALLKKADGSYSEIGKSKAEWADKIGRYLNIEHNQSPSFNYLITQIKSRLAT